jgi:TetR/AcrR family transcriptional repressor of lmrAB and yxaGH operons
VHRHRRASVRSVATRTHVRSSFFIASMVDVNRTCALVLMRRRSRLSPRVTAAAATTTTQRIVIDMAARRTDTRDKMIRSAVRLFQRQGYVGTTMLQVVEDSGASRGSIYFHFRGGKEELGREVLDRSRQDVVELAHRCAERATDASETVLHLADTLADGMRNSGFLEGCPVATMALEMTPACEELRAACDGYFLEWQRALSLHFLDAGMPRARAQVLASVAVSTLEGALILARTSLSTRPLDVAGTELSALVSASLPLGRGRSPKSSEAA